MPGPSKRGLRRAFECAEEAQRLLDPQTPQDALEPERAAKVFGLLSTIRMELYYALTWVKDDSPQEEE